ncbi:MAG: FAD-dependent monooxygenase [Trueperaceae bacterium]
MPRPETHVHNGLPTSVEAAGERVARTALVLGSSLAGLAAAAALAPHVGTVIVLERDRLPGVDEARKGVPQGRHVHLLKPAGLHALERLLPGIEDDLKRAGAQVLRGGHEFGIYVGGGRLDLSHLNPSFALIGATRPLIEGVIRERVRALPNVDVRTGLDVIGLTTDDTGAVSGVRFGRQGDAPSGAPAATDVLRADLVVDATGRGSRAPRWLADLGFRPPSEDTVQVDLRYATRLFRRPPAAGHGPRNTLVAPLPGQRRGAVALAVEGERWIVTLVGMLGERPPTEIGAFRAYARSLWNPAVHDLIAGAEPVGEAVTGGYPGNVRRRYDELRAFPRRFVVTGDALGNTSPVNGLGMSMAVIEAEKLGETLARVGPERIGPTFFRSVRRLLEESYTQAVDNDLRHPAVEGPRTMRWRVIGAYSKRLVPLAHRDPVVGRALSDVMGFLAPGASLMRPNVVWRVLLRGGRRPAVAQASRVRQDDALVP